MGAVGIGLGLVAGPAGAHEPEFEQTRQLIALVEGAADLIAEKGVAAACDAFRREGTPWLDGDTYVFVLDLDGKAICHPVKPSLEGKSLLELRDPHGKPIVQSFLRELEGGKPDGWVHYLWPRPDSALNFFWKTAYIRRATSPEGPEYVVGSGLYQMKMERFFVVEQVNDAADLIARHGEEAFATLRDKGSGFRFYDAYIFVLDRAGNVLVNVGFPEREGRNDLELADPTGKKIIREMLALLERQESGWVDYLWPRPGDTATARKSSFVRRLDLDGRMLMVGAGVYFDQ